MVGPESHHRPSWPESSLWICQAIAPTSRIAAHERGEASYHGLTRAVMSTDVGVQSAIQTMAVFTIARMTARIASGRWGHALTMAGHFRLGFVCPLSSHVLSLTVAESGFHELEPEESVMLSLFPNERRRSRRLQTVPNQADLEWWDRSQKRSSHGKILNISDHGALIFADSFPQLGENVLIRIKRPVQSDWAGSTVVRHDQPNEVAIDFNMGCPYDLGLAATLGIDIISSVLGLAGSDRFSNSGD